MKLIQCHIENFGKLVNYDYHFVGGLNRIKAENGWGKSTFATFLKAMFYGLPATTKKNLNENERKKYQPWQGGNYGGNLVFEINQKQYKIERFFGKNKNEDVCTIFDVKTGKPTKDFSENVGLEIFGLDEAAFERSSYIPQKIIESSLNESITQKLNNLMQGVTEEYNFANTYARLDKKRAWLSNKQKTGEIQNLQGRIDAVTTKMRDLELQAEKISDLQKQVVTKDATIKSLLQTQNQIKSQINAYGQLQQKQANQELFVELSRKIAVTKNEIQDRQELLNQQQITTAEIDAMMIKNQAVIAQTNEIKVKSMNDYVNQRYQTLTNYFHGKIPTNDQVQAVYNDVLQFNALKAQTDGTVTRQATVQQRRRFGLSLGLVLLALLGIIGGGFIIQSQVMLAVTLFVMGGVLLLVAGYLSLVNLINVKTSVPQNIDLEKLQKTQTEMLRLQNKITAFTYAYESTNDYLGAINRLMANLREYDEIKAQMTRQTQEIETLTQIVAQTQSQIEQYLARFNFKQPSQSATDKLVTLKQTLTDLARLTQRLTVETDELEQFKKAKHFDVDDAPLTYVDINELQHEEKKSQMQIDAYRDEKSQLVAQIMKIQNDLTALDDLVDQKADLQAKLKTLEQKFAAVKSAMKFLQMASDSLSAKFLAPMKTGLQKYLTMITTKKYDNLQLDTDFQVAFEEYGQLRAVEYYSQGYQNTIDLCLRFALIDALYQQEKPVLILDDPLTNLDEAKITQAKHFLQALAKTYQLVYFSCHDAR